MSKKTVKNIYIIYGTVLSALLILTGILLIISCLNIYNSGPRPFTPENISAAFNKIAIPLWITLAAIIGGFILKLLLPEEKGKTKTIKDKKSTLCRLKNMLDKDVRGDKTFASIKKEETLRRRLHILAWTLCTVTALPALVYSLIFNNFTADYNASVISACALLIPCSLISMGICTALVYLEDASYDREIAVVKSILAKSSGILNKGDSPERTSNKKAVKIIRTIFAAIAIIFIVLGIFNGGMADVLSKAINICTECIGLG